MVWVEESRQTGWYRWKRVDRLGGMGGKRVDRLGGMGGGD